MVLMIKPFNKHIASLMDIELQLSSPKCFVWTRPLGKTLVREAAKNTLRGRSLKIAAFGHKVLTPPRFAAKNA